MTQQLCVIQSLRFSLFYGCSKCSIGTIFCSFVKNMGDKLLKQQIDIKFLVKLKKNASDIYKSYG